MTNNGTKLTDATHLRLIGPGGHSNAYTRIIRPAYMSNVVTRQAYRLLGNGYWSPIGYPQI